MAAVLGVVSLGWLGVIVGDPAGSPTTAYGEPRFEQRVPRLARWKTTSQSFWWSSG